MDCGFESWSSCGRRGADLPVTTTPEDEMRNAQHEVQRLLGRCLMRLQQYERLLKALLASHTHAGPVHELEAIRKDREVEVARKTLGTLVGDLLGAFLVPAEPGEPAESVADHADDRDRFSFLLQAQMPDTVLAKTREDLGELVRLRNSLVHNFLDQHDVWTLTGCQGAQEALVDAYERIDQHLGHLRVWITETQQVRSFALDMLQSDQFLEMLDERFAASARAELPQVRIVQAFVEAAGELAVDGWVPVEKAARWVAERTPDELPTRYGCRTWRQVLHESRRFELRHMTIGGRRCACYRVRPTARPLCTN